MGNKNAVFILRNIRNIRKWVKDEDVRQPADIRLKKRLLSGQVPQSRSQFPQVLYGRMRVLQEGCFRFPDKDASDGLMDRLESDVNLKGVFARRRKCVIFAHMLSDGG